MACDPFHRTWEERFILGLPPFLGFILPGQVPETETFGGDDPKQCWMEEGNRERSSEIGKGQRMVGMRKVQGSSMGRFHGVSPTGGLWKQNI